MIDIPQTFRYSVVSTICLLLCTAAVPLLNLVGVHYVFATFVGFCVSALTGFTLHSRWTFGVERSFPAFVRYFSTVSLNLPLTIVLIGLAHDGVGFSVGVSSVIASAILVIWNFIAVRWAIMPRLPEARPEGPPARR